MHSETASILQLNIVSTSISWIKMALNVSLLLHIFTDFFGLVLLVMRDVSTMIYLFFASVLPGLTSYILKLYYLVHSRDLHFYIYVLNIFIKMAIYAHILILKYIYFISSRNKVKIFCRISNTKWSINSK